MKSMRDAIQTGKRPMLWCVCITIGIVAGAAAVQQLGHNEAPSHPTIVKVDLSPIRGEVRPLRLRRDGFEYKCNECHQSIDPNRKNHHLIAEHTDLILEHGSNDYCLNCHHKSNRNAYTGHDGSEIPSDQPARLCGKCHGLVYRDWLAGAHGKLTGNWSPNNKNAVRLLCIQCHDPHRPKFPPLKPMPGPQRGRVHFTGEF